MGYALKRLAFAVAAPLLLLGCILTPGKFTANLSINADRSFTFAYKGEVIAVDPADEIGKGFDAGRPDSEDTSESGEWETPADPDDETIEAEPSLFQPVAWQASDEARSEKDKKAETERKRRAIAEALSKEAGYRSVEYVGDGKFIIDYAVSGRLDHNFVYPYNLDAEIIFPFIAIELRKNGTVRVKAPAFGNETTKDATPGRDEAAKLLDGVFTLDTDAEIISQNNEDGVEIVHGRKTIVWKATPLSKAAPMAVLRMGK